MAFKFTASRRLGWIVLIGLGLVWGSFFILVKRSLDGFTPFEIAGLRTVIVMVCLSPFLFSALAAINRRNVLAVFYMSLVGNGTPLILYPIAQTHITSAVAGIVNALTPLFTLLISWALFSLRTTVSMWLGLAVGFGGAVVLVVGGPGNITGELLYVGMAMLCAASNGLNSNILSRHLRGIPAPQTASLMFSIVAVPMTIGMIWTGSFTNIAHGNFDMTAMFWMVLLSVATAGAVVLYNWMIVGYGPLFASTTTYLLPAVAIGWGVLDGETVGLREFLGVALILSGIYLTNRQIARPTGPKPFTRD